ncbi:MAG: hypothetical protein ACFFD1_13170 [Candidatus Thorarchaeota archaeon]
MTKVATVIGLIGILLGAGGLGLGFLVWSNQNDIQTNLTQLNSDIQSNPNRSLSPKI